MNLSFSALGWLPSFDGSDHQVSTWLCLVLLPFLSRAGLFLLLALGFFFVNKLSSLLFLFLLLMWPLWPLKLCCFLGLITLYEFSFLLKLVQLLALCHWHWAILLPEYFFKSIFPLKGPQAALVLCCMAGLVLPTEATFTLSVGALLSIYWMTKMTTVSNSFLYLFGCTLTVARTVDNILRLMSFNRYQSFDPG